MIILHYVFVLHKETEIVIEHVIDTLPTHFHYILFQFKNRT